jgi:DNA-binding transcriptional MerR regulator
MPIDQVGDPMKIGELSKRSGLTPSRIRFYEAEGLLNAVSRQANGYREYPPDAVLALGIVTRAQQVGFSLNEIRQVLPNDLSSWQHDRLVDVLQRKIADIEIMERQLSYSKSRLRTLIQDTQDRPEGVSCSENAARLLQQHARTA